MFSKILTEDTPYLTCEGKIWDLICEFNIALQYNTEMEMSFWRNLHHWLHRKLSKWQLSVQLMMTISWKLIIEVQINWFHLSQCRSSSSEINGIFQVVSVFLHFVLLFILHLLMLPNGTLVPPFPSKQGYEDYLQTHCSIQCISNITISHKAILVPPYDNSA